MTTRPLLSVALAAALVASLAASSDAKKHKKPHVTNKPGVHINLGQWGNFGGPRLGAQVQPLTDDLRKFFGAKPGVGVLVGKVMPGSAAASAGLRAGDVVTSIDGKPVAGIAEVWGALRGKKKGDKVVVGVVRNKRARTITATIQGMTGSPIAKLGHVLKQLDALKDLDVDIDVPDILMHMSNGAIHIPPMGKIRVPDIDFDLSQVPGVQRSKMKQKLDDAEKRIQRLEQRLRKLEKQRKTK